MFGLYGMFILPYHVRTKGATNRDDAYNHGPISQCYNLYLSSIWTNFYLALLSDKVKH